MKKIPIAIKIIFCVVVLVSAFVFITIFTFRNNLINYLTKPLDMPIIKIYTEDNKAIISKEEYIKCQVSVTNAESENYNFSNFDAKIKGRGNSTWFHYEKKPYKLKFEEKVDLFGNGKSKTWTLIANAQDNSSIRNYMAYSIGENLLNYTTTTQFVEVYLNSKYIGVYLVCEQIETGDNRVEIDESLDYVDTGYLIEQDARAPSEGVEGFDYFVCEDRCFVLKTPDTEDEEYSTEYLEFIKNYFEKCFGTLKGNNFQEVCDLINVDTFVDTFIINEIFNNSDVDFSSFFLYKDAGGKLCSGPIWDYDSCAGNAGEETGKGSNNPELNIAHNNIFYNYLLTFKEFENKIAFRLETTKNLIKKIVNEKCDYVLDVYKNSFQRNFDVLGLYNERLIELKTWQENVEYLRNWLMKSLDYTCDYFI